MADENTPTPEEQTEQVDQTNQPKQEDAQEQVKEENLKVDSPYAGPAADKAARDRGDILNFLMMSYNRYKKMIDEAPQSEYGSSEDGRDWLEAISQGAITIPPDGRWTKTVDREDSVWRQFIEYEGSKLASARPRISSTEENTSISGDRAIYKLNDAMGLGTVVQVPLWHSGLWVTIKSPTDADLLEMERRIARAKVSLGKDTNGLIFSSQSFYIDMFLLDTIFKHVYDSTSNISNPKTFKRIIRLTDLPSLIWGFACAINPNGYEFSRPCVSNIESCRHVTEERLSLPRLQWTDKNALTKSQLAHMALRTSKHKYEEFEKYQKAHTHGSDRVVEINSKLSIRLSVPTLEAYLEHGSRWIGELTTLVDESFENEYEDDDDRDVLLRLQAKLSELRSLDQWVSEIILSDGQNSIVDKDTISDSMSRLSSDETIRDKVIDAIMEYIDDATISLIAIPNYDCPKCGGEQEDNHDRYNYLIPLSVSAIFFILRDQRLSRIRR